MIEDMITGGIDPMRVTALSHCAQPSRSSISCKVACASASLDTRRPSKHIGNLKTALFAHLAKCAKGPAGGRGIAR
jgi:hypothetical protein